MTLWIKRALLVMLAVVGLALAIRYHREVIAFLSNEQQLEAWLDQLGPLGPLAVIGLNALQVIVAFIPGYAMQVASGYLYGFPLGAVYGAIGMAIGGIVAMMLARAYGRPLVVRMVGENRMRRWEGVAHLNSLPIWFFLMLGPFGDIPYYIAGLTTLAVWKIIAVALLVRTPSVFVAAAVGDGLVDWRSPWIIGGAALLMLVGVIALRYQGRIELWVDQKVLPRVVRLSKDKTPPPAVPEPSLEALECDATTH